MPSFGWVISPAARDPEGARTLNQENRRFIERIRSHFDMIWVEDHFQWEDRPLLECWTTLAYLAGQYTDFHFGPLVMGQSYRNPALTAKMLATLSWLTGGRIVAGIGGGWKEDEYHAYGWPYPSARSRIGQLEETVQIFKALWTQSPATFEGQYYTIREAYCEPRPDPPPPILIGGGGERLTLRVVAKYADWMNVGFCDAATYQHKLKVLEDHCQAEGRPYNEIKKTYFGFVSIFEQEEERQARENLHIIQGSSAEVTNELTNFADLGVEHFMLRFIDFPRTYSLDRFLENVLPNLQ
jgi:alkanesulfonate monooxygenase SsuD/methylene tetrahydromethanopterin reductase-like flavin-dependent oxidoreductase (luciferase family)